MFQRFLEQKDALVLFLADEDNFSITGNDWRNIKIFVEVLEPLYSCTLEICAEKLTTLSKVVPIIKILKSYYGKYASENYADQRIKEFKQNIYNSLVTRFGKIEDMGKSFLQFLI